MAVYFSEIRFEDHQDFVEIVASDGEDLSGYSIAVYNSSGNLHSTHSLTGEYIATFAGQDVYLVDTADGLNDMGQQWGVALIANGGGVVQFVSGEGNLITASDGPAAGATSYAAPNTSNDESIETDSGGTSYYAQTAPNPGVVLCFAAGTLIDTPTGPRPVEDLAPGDPVTTRDNGAKPILWRSARHLGAAELATAPKLGPVRIRAGALGAGLPARDLIVSPQHRILVTSKIAERMAGRPDVLVPAATLTRLPGIARIRPRDGISYHHFMFDRHEIVFSNGAASESFFPGDHALDAIGAAARAELFALFPDLAARLPGGTLSAARPILDGKRANHLVRRHRRNAKALAPA